MSLIRENKLSGLLGIDDAAVRKFRTDGMPVGKSGFDLLAVAQWLAKELILATEPTILRTRAEAANHFGVNERTVATWLGQKGFPGRSATPGKQDGHFPADEIAEWLGESRKGKRNGEPDPSANYRARLVLAKAEMAEDELRKSRDSVIDADEARRFFVRTNSYAVSLLKQLTGRVESRLPRGVSKNAKAKIRQACNETIAETCEMMAELIEGDEDDKVQ